MKKALILLALSVVSTASYADLDRGTYTCTDKSGSSSEMEVRDGSYSRIVLSYEGRYEKTTVRLKNNKLMGASSVQAYTDVDDENQGILVLTLDSNRFSYAIDKYKIKYDCKLEN